MSRFLVVSALLFPLDAFAGCLKLTEAFPNPLGADSGFEWVELYNRCDPATQVDLTKFVLRIGHAGVTSDLPLSGSLVGTGFFVVGEASVADADLTVAALDLRNGLNETDYLAIVKVSDGSVQDTLVYGSPNTSGWLDDNGAVATSFAPAPADDRALARVMELTDEDDCGVAWLETLNETPGRANSINPANCTGGNAFKINELSSDPALGEWVELVNVSGADADASGWQLRSGVTWMTDGMVIPDGTLVPAGGTLLVASAAMPGADVVDRRLVVPTAQPGETVALRLHRCSGAKVDSAIYGDLGGTLWAEDDNLAVTDPAPSPSATASVSRRIDGVDTDDSGADYVATTVPTPNAPNLHLETTVPLASGQPGQLTVFNAEPNELVHFAGSAQQGNGPCPPQLGGACLDLLAPVLVGSARADAVGTAVLDLVVPPLPPIEVFSQAAIVRGAGGVDSVVTNVNADQL